MGWRDYEFDPQTYGPQGAGGLLGLFQGMLQPSSAVPDTSANPSTNPNYSPETPLSPPQDLIGRLRGQQEEQSSYTPAPAPLEPYTRRDVGKRILAQSINETAQKLGIDPQDLATAISYETAGTFDPWKAGPTTQYGQHRGLIQWGEPQRKQYGVTQNSSVPEQMEAVRRYLIDAGVKPGMGLLDVYSAINAGRVGRYSRSDANNGGAPGTVADKVNNQMADHRRNAIRLLQRYGGPIAQSSDAAAPVGPSNVTTPARPTLDVREPDSRVRYLRSRRAD